MEVIAITILVFVICVGLGWVVPIVIGIIRMRRRVPGGLAYTIVGGVWGLVMVALGVVAGVGYRQVPDSGGIEDFDPGKYEGSTGSIVVPYEAESRLTVEDRERRKLVRLSAANGVLMAPVGSYGLFSYEAVGKDANNVEWVASCYFTSRKAREITVGADSRVGLEVGPPFTASVAVKGQGQDRVTFDLVLRGRGGDQYAVNRRDGRREAPGFEVISKSGEILWQGKFEYG